MKGDLKTFKSEKSTTLKKFIDNSIRDGHIQVNTHLILELSQCKERGEEAIQVARRRLRGNLMGMNRNIKKYIAHLQ